MTTGRRCWPRRRPSAWSRAGSQRAPATGSGAELGLVLIRIGRTSPTSRPAGPPTRPETGPTDPESSGSGGDQAPGRHPLTQRADLGQAAGHGRIERLGGRDGGLDRGQAQDPLGRRRQPDLDGVADAPPTAGVGVLTTRRDLARADQLQDRQRRRRRPAPPSSRSWRRAGTGSPGRPGRAAVPSVALSSKPARVSAAASRPEEGLVAVGDREQGQRAAGRAPGRGGTSDAATRALARATAGIAMDPDHLARLTACLGRPTDRLRAAWPSRRPAP